MAQEKKKTYNLAELLGENSTKNENDPSQQEELDREKNEDLFKNKEVFSVYILQRVVKETIRLCKEAIPNEAIGVLLGYKLQFEGKKYVKVVDWATGRANQSHVFAEFTPEGVRQYTTFIEERYGECENKPRIVGIIHSHPFGSNPSFSATDYNTFLNFPYDAEHNVFVLVDPKSGYYKTYILLKDELLGKHLEEVDWIEYTIR